MFPLMRQLPTPPLLTPGSSALCVSAPARRASSAGRRARSAFDQPGVQVLTACATHRDDAPVAVDIPLLARDRPPRRCALASRVSRARRNANAIHSRDKSGRSRARRCREVSPTPETLWWAPTTVMHGPDMRRFHTRRGTESSPFAEPRRLAGTATHARNAPQSAEVVQSTNAASRATETTAQGLRACQAHDCPERRPNAPWASIPSPWPL